MRARLVTSARVDVILETLPERDLQKVINILDLLSEFPLMGAATDVPDTFGVRRTLAGKYLIYYRYDAEHAIVRIVSFRHGYQKPIEADELAE